MVLRSRDVRLDSTHSGLIVLLVNIPMDIDSSTKSWEGNSGVLLEGETDWFLDLSWWGWRAKTVSDRLVEMLPACIVHCHLLRCGVSRAGLPVNLRPTQYSLRDDGLLLSLKYNDYVTLALIIEPSVLHIALWFTKSEWGISGYVMLSGFVIS